MAQHSGWLKWPKTKGGCLVWDYPLIAPREAITNAICHRDYGDVADIQIKIFENRLEVPARTTDHHLAKLISGAKTERRGSKKTGGYY
jgi:hypothetical protein